MHYNMAFPGHQIAMPPPLSDGIVTYTDGTKPTLDNYARDVSAYLMWAAEPKLEERHQVGVRVMAFLDRLRRDHVLGQARWFGRACTRTPHPRREDGLTASSPAGLDPQSRSCSSRAGMARAVRLR